MLNHKNGEQLDACTHCPKVVQTKNQPMSRSPIRRGVFNAAGTGATSDSNYAPRSHKKLEKRIVLLVVNLQFSEFSENGISDLIVHLHNSESVFWPIAETSLNLSWPCPVPRKKSLDHNSKFWWPVRKFGKVDGLVWYLSKMAYWHTKSVKSLINRKLF